MRDKLVDFAAVLFISSVVAVAVSGVLFGGSGIEWITATMINPSLMLIGGVVGFGDIRELGKCLRRGREPTSSADWLGIVFLLGRGASFIAIFAVFAFMEFKLLSEVLPRVCCVPESGHTDAVDVTDHQ